MAKYNVDQTTGAIIVKPSKEEVEKADLKKKVKYLEDEVRSLNMKVDLLVSTLIGGDLDDK